MNRLGIDYGEKRWGLAYSDELGVATPLEAITQSSIDQRWEFLLELIRQRRIAETVVGYPLNMDGTVGFKAREVDAFIDELAGKLENRIPVFRVDERLTSASASESWSLKKQKQERRSGKLDSRAAALILQDYLDRPDSAIIQSENEENHNG